MQKNISLRPLNIGNDFERFYEWNSQPRVSKFWDLNHSREDVKSYLESVIQSTHQVSMIIEINQEPAGYCEIYWAKDDRIAEHYNCEPYDRGFHFLIGEKKFLGSENTLAVMKAIMKFIYFDDIRTERIVGEPNIENARVIKYINMIPSWKFVKEFDFPEKRAALFISHREHFL